MGNVNGKSLIFSKKALEAACADLRHEVEHQGGNSPIILLGPTYKATDPNAIKTVTMDGIQVGYQVAHIKGAHFMRKIFVKVPGYRWSDVPNREKDEILTAVFNGILQEQMDVDIELIASDCYLITQVFEVAFQYEKNPDLRSIAGGVDLDRRGKIVNS